MSLVLTEVSDFGIAMAADSAESVTRDPYEYVRFGARKLQPIYSFNGGFSAWGMGSIENIPLDIWMEKFIEDQSNVEGVREFAKALADKLNASDIPLGEPLGFHLAAWVGEQPDWKPLAYHVHRGERQTGQMNPDSTSSESYSIDPDFDPNKFNANLDIPPGCSDVIRNGMHKDYNNLAKRLEDFIYERVNAFKVGSNPIHLPSPPYDLKKRAELLKFYIRTISDIYRIGNIEQIVGGPISTLSISHSGIHHYSME